MSAVALHLTSVRFPYVQDSAIEELSPAGLAAVVHGRSWRLAPQKLLSSSLTVWNFNATALTSGKDRQLGSGFKPAGKPPLAFPTAARSQDNDGLHTFHHHGLSTR